MKNKLFDLAGQITVITGGGKGLGRAMALGMADAGATVVVLGRTLEPLQSTTEEIIKMGSTAEFYQVDVLNEQAVKELVQETLSRHATPASFVYSTGRKAWARLTMGENVNHDKNIWHFH